MSKKYIADNIEVSTSLTLGGNNVLTTASGYATEIYVGNAISGLIDSAPATLDTLNELAAALGDDPNFATTVSNSIGLKWTQDNVKISNWDTAFSWGNHAGLYSLLGHTHPYLPLTGGTLTGALNGLGANFTDPVTIYDNASSENPRLSVGRGATESLNIDVEDRVAKIYHVQDEASGGHSMEFSINSPDPSKTFYWVGKQTDATSPVTFMTLNSSGITATGYNNTNWDTAYGWGNHAGLYQPLNSTLSRFSDSSWAGTSGYPGYTFTGGNSRIGFSSTSGVVDVYADGNFYATDSSFRVWHAGDFSSTNISNWNTAYGWGNHAGLYASVNHTHIISPISETAVPSAGISIQAGPGSNNTQGWAYPYGTRLSVITSAARSFEIMSTTYPNGELVMRTLDGSNVWDAWKTIIDSSNIGSQSVSYASNAGTLDSIDSSQFLRSDAADSWSQLLTYNGSGNGLQVGGIRGTFGGVELIHLYNRVHIGTPAGWGAQGAPDYGLSTYGGVDLAVNQGYTTSGGSMRAPIFYDSNDTGYYLDPTGTTNINKIIIGNKFVVEPTGWSNADADQWPYFFWHRDTANGWDEGLIKASSSRGFFGKAGWGIHMDSNRAFHIFSSGWTANFGVEHGGTAIASGSFRAPVFYDNNDTGYYLDPNTTNTAAKIRGGIDQYGLVGRPMAAWGAGGGTTGAVVIKFPGGTGNYGMIHAVIDIYEYNGNHACSVIVGGHNWGDRWYNYGAQIIGFTDKEVRVGVKDGKYCIIIGNGSSYWSYGQVVLRKIQNGDYYRNIMDVGSGYTVGIESDSYSWVSGDLRGLSISGTIYSSLDVRAPIFYDSNDTTYYANPNSTSRFRDLWVRGDNQYQGYVMVGGDSAGAALSINFDQIWTSVGNLHLQYSSAGNIDMNQGGGYTFSRTSLRAPVFYDYDNTGYYLNPAGGSYLGYTHIYRDVSIGGVGNTNMSNYGLRIQDPFANLYLDGNCIYSDGTIAIGTHTFNSLIFVTNNANAASFTANGNLLIGTTSPTNGTSSYGATFETQEGNGTRVLKLGSSSTGTIYLQRFYNSYGQVGGIYTEAGSTYYASTSDYRLKENIVDITNSVEVLKTLKPKKYNFKNDNREILGFIAHEFKEVLPYAVSGEKDDVDEEGNPVYQSLDQTRIIPILTAALQEAIKRIEELENKVNGIN